MVGNEGDWVKSLVEGKARKSCDGAGRQAAARSTAAGAVQSEGAKGSRVPEICPTGVVDSTAKLQRYTAVVWTGCEPLVPRSTFSEGHTIISGNTPVSCSSGENIWVRAGGCALNCPNLFYFSDCNTPATTAAVSRSSATTVLRMG